jgi:hypothetical protein
MLHQNKFKCNPRINQITARHLIKELQKGQRRPKLILISFVAVMFMCVVFVMSVLWIAINREVVGKGESFGYL